MNKLISSALMTVVAVPFLMAAPAASKVQNAAPAANSTTTAKKTAKKHVKKAKTAAKATTDTTAKK